MSDLASALPFGLKIVATLSLTCILTAISFVDLKTLRIPNMLSLPVIAAGLTLAFAFPGVDALDNVAGTIAAYLLFAGLGAFYFKLRRSDGLGLGDAKLFAGAGAWLGWQALPMVLLLASVAGLLQIFLRAKDQRNRPIAFGPFIAMAFWTVWMSSIWYNSMF